jgi:hypothetical protein
MFAAEREETGAVRNLPLIEEKEAFTWRLTPPKKALRPLDETPANGWRRNPPLPVCNRAESSYVDGADWQAVS